MDKPLTDSALTRRFLDRTPGSRELFERSQAVFPGGFTHDSRVIDPYQLYIERADGARKWDVDGNEYVDFFGGHGALLLGHNFPAVVEAVEAQMRRGTHYGSNHRLELEWGETIKRMVPCAERVRFTSSGTEATMMALRLARAFTGRSRFVRFAGHFHGWQDHVVVGQKLQGANAVPAGVLGEVAAGAVVAPADDMATTQAILERQDDLAAVILEPTGASFGRLPMAPDFLAMLRGITERRGIVLIFDEVVTGFRVAPGGAQGRFGLTPDLTTLGKIVAGGLPGAAVVGRAEILDQIDAKAAQASGREKIGHQGTFNANPLSAAAGLAALKAVETTDACERANATAAEIRRRLNELFEAEGVPWAAYGTFSGFHVFLNPQGKAIRPTRFEPDSVSFAELKDHSPALANRLKIAMLAHGVDLSPSPGGLLSAVHGEPEIEASVEAFRAATRALRAEGDIPG